MAEELKNKEGQIAAFASSQKSASDQLRRPSGPGFCFTADRSRPHTDQHLENILANNIGISELLTKREA